MSKWGMSPEKPGVNCCAFLTAYPTPRDRLSWHELEGGGGAEIYQPGSVGQRLREGRGLAWWPPEGYVRVMGVECICAHRLRADTFFCHTSKAYIRMVVCTARSCFLSAVSSFRRGASWRDIYALWLRCTSYARRRSVHGQREGAAGHTRFVGPFLVLC